MSDTPLTVLTATISDSRTAADDRSGPALVEGLTRAGFVVVRHVIVADEVDAITALVRTVAASGEAQALVLTGGTGIGPRDRTCEALAPLYDVTLDGFGEIFRRLSFDQIGPRALLSRASAGAVGALLVFSLPGSVHAATLGVNEVVAPVLRHAVAQRAGRGHP